MTDGENRSAPRWAALLVVGLTGALLLACTVSSLSPSTPSPTAIPTLQPLPSPTPPPLPADTPAPGAQQGGEVRISEQEMNQWLQEARAELGEDVGLSDASIKIRSTGITLTGTAKVTQMQGAQCPIEIVLKPIVRNERLSLEVLDVRLGGAYASFSSLIKPLISAGIAQSMESDAFLAEQGMRISKVELHEGYLIVTRAPAN